MSPVCGAVGNFVGMCLVLNVLLPPSPRVAGRSPWAIRLPGAFPVRTSAVTVTARIQDDLCWARLRPLGFRVQGLQCARKGRSRRNWGNALRKLQTYKDLSFMYQSDLAASTVCKCEDRVRLLCVEITRLSRAERPRY